MTVWEPNRGIYGGDDKTVTLLDKNPNLKYIYEKNYKKIILIFLKGVIFAIFYFFIYLNIRVLN